MNKKISPSSQKIHNSAAFSGNIEHTNQSHPTNPSKLSPSEIKNISRN
jgi:hypothetical protein